MSKHILVTGILAVAFFRGIFAADAGPDVVASQDAAPSKNESVNITTLRGVTYENCRLLRVEPDGISYRHSRGIAKLFFSELPPEYAKQYGYNPQTAQDYSQSVQEKQARFRQDQEEANQRDLQDRGERLAEIQANPKFTVVAKGGKNGGFGSVGASVSSANKANSGSGVSIVEVPGGRYIYGLKGLGRSGVLSEQQKDSSGRLIIPGVTSVTRLDKNDFNSAAGWQNSPGTGAGAGEFEKIIGGVDGLDPTYRKKTYGY